ncbi:Alpha/beta hydrolase family protein [Fodinibius roseus]|uniref:Alpha/beta hydrolase family protein n=1 Tax=Fodinibius roseus TaxID=1194090 RepID=A0A1M4W1P7_9BACT|nr:alpha/beta fold hydrolase [Fodinibius roseus]SHE75085.1 Alpha/beta hydrolase family protein [Fodinibius roseus]
MTKKWFIKSLGLEIMGMSLDKKSGFLFFFVICLLNISLSKVQAQSDEHPFTIERSADNSIKRISSIAEWERQRWSIIKGMEEVMGELPQRIDLPPLNMQVSDTLRTDNYSRLTISFTVAKEEKVPAYLYIPHRSGVTGKLPAMLALHPTGEIGKDIVDGQGLANRGYAKELAERGYIVIAPDYPGFGALEEYKFDRDRYKSGTMKGIFNHMRSVDLLQKREDVNPHKIGVIGHSLGGHNAMFVAAFDTRLKVVVSSSGWTQLGYYDTGKAAHDKYGGRLGPWAQDVYMPLLRDRYNLDDNIIPFDFHEIIAVIAPRFFFSNSPVKDNNFEVNGVRKGISKSRKVYKFLNADENLQVRYPESGHDFPTKVRREAYQFIDKVFDHTPFEHEIE